MKFEEWYQTMPPLVNPEKQIARIGWQACKNEILKILNKHRRNMVDTELQRDMETYIDLDCLEEIEKL